MTWYFNPSGTTMDVYDHTGSKVRQNYQFSGSWGGDYPDEIEEIMADEIQANSNTGSGNAPIATEYAVLALIDCIRGDIQQGTP